MGKTKTDNQKPLRLGLERENNQGLKMKIVEYFNAKNLTILFLEDGATVTKKSWEHFMDGKISHPTYRKDAEKRIGEEVVNFRGHTCKIIEYFGANNITVQFDDGSISTNRNYVQFQRGNIASPKLHFDRNEGRVGEVATTNQGFRITITRYNNSSDIDVIFEDGYSKNNTTYAKFKSGGLQHPLAKTVCGVACLGDGEYTPENSREGHRCWTQMINRVHFPSESGKRYHDKVKICEDWYNFQNFQKWYEENSFDSLGDLLVVDKDFINRASNLYSPETAILCPQKMNLLIIGRNGSKNGLPTGVTKVSKNRYGVLVNENGHQSFVGSYETVEEAQNAYRNAKKEVLNRKAQEYMEYYPDFPQKLYNILINYEVY